MARQKNTDRMPDSASDPRPSRPVSAPEQFRTTGGADGDSTGGPKVRWSAGPEEIETELEQLSVQLPEDIFDVDFTGDKAVDLRWLAEQPNLAHYITGGACAFFGDELIRLVSIDDLSRSEWLDGFERGLRLADLTARQSSVKVTDEDESGEAPPPRYPMVAKAVVEFAADAFTTLLGDRDVVKCSSIVSETAEPPGPQAQPPGPQAQPPGPQAQPPGPQAQPDAAADRLQRLSAFMSWAVTTADSAWATDTDKMLHNVAMGGVVWRKVIPVDPVTGVQRTEFVCAKDMIINNSTTNVATVPRIAHRLRKYPHEVRQHVASGYFCNVESQMLDQSDVHAPLEFYEVHTWFDLDGDNIDEPWIFTVHESTRMVVRLVAGFDVDGINFMEKDSDSDSDIVRFEQQRYFFDYHFIPNFDGSFHSIGFGHLLGRMNETVDELINTVIRLAKRNAANSGLIGRLGDGLPSSMDIREDELQVVSLDGNSLRDSVVLFPTKEVPQTLFSVIGLLVSTADQLASAIDLSQAPAGMPATTAMAIVEQGSKIHSSIYRRLWRAMTAEFEGRFVWFQKQAQTQGFQITFEHGGRVQSVSGPDFGSVPVTSVNADPNITTSAHRAALASYYQSLMADQFTNQPELRGRMHELMRVPNARALIAPPPGPDPLSQAKLMDSQTRAAELELKRLELLGKLQESEQKARLIAAQAAHQLILAITELANLRAGNSVSAVAPPSGNAGGGGPGSNKEPKPGDGASAPASPEAVAKAEGAIKEAYELLTRLTGENRDGGIFGTGTPIGQPSQSAPSAGGPATPTATS